MEHDRIRILLVEDDESFASLLQRALARHEFFTFQIYHVTRLSEAIRMVQNNVFDVVLLDLTLPDEYGLDTFARMKAAVQIPIVILTGSENTSLGLQAVREGAQDFLSKDSNLSSVARSLLYSIERRKVARQEKELAAAEERLQVVSQFFQDLAHDLRTPMTAVNNNIYLLRTLVSSNDAKEKIEDRLETLAKQMERLQHLTDNLFTLSQLDAGITASHKTIGRLSFTTALYDVVEALELEAHRKHQKIIVETDPQEIVFFCDTVQFSRMLQNLVLNAINYTPEGGTISCRAYRQNSYGVIEISDTGIGIPDNQLPHIFDRLYRGDRARSTIGAGLGLSIVKRVVDLHNGRIEVESKEGQGTSFYLLFPVM